MEIFVNGSLNLFNHRTNVDLSNRLIAFDIAGLKDEEYDVIKEHTTKGHEVLKDISAVPELAVGALSHHERHDGKGYPNGLSGNDIPEVARIIAVADSFEPNRRPVGDSLPKLLTILKTASCQGGLFCLPSCC